MNKISLLKNAKKISYSNNGTKRRNLIIKNIEKQANEQGFTIEVLDNKIKIVETSQFILLPKILETETKNFEVRSKNLVIFIQGKPLFVNLKDITIINKNTLSTSCGIITIKEVL